MPSDSKMKKSERKLNAFRHGACSRADGLLPFEDPNDYEKLRAEYFSHFMPESLIETECVEAVVRNRWELKRAIRILQAFHDSQSFSRTISEHGGDLTAAVRDRVALQRRTLEELQEAANSVKKAAKQAGLRNSVKAS
jgi:hypothetical protein